MFSVPGFVAGSRSAIEAGLRGIGDDAAQPLRRLPVSRGVHLQTVVGAVGLEPDLVVDVEIAGIRVSHVHGAGCAVADVAGRPHVREFTTAHRQLADEVGQSGVAGVASRGQPQVCDVDARELLPIPVLAA